MAVVPLARRGHGAPGSARPPPLPSRPPRPWRAALARDAAPSLSPGAVVAPRGAQCPARPPGARRLVPSRPPPLCSLAWLAVSRRGPAYVRCPGAVRRGMPCPGASWRMRVAPGAAPARLGAVWPRRACGRLARDGLRSARSAACLRRGLRPTGTVCARVGSVAPAWLSAFPRDVPLARPPAPPCATCLGVATSVTARHVRRTARTR
jgi:hypothetical protein